MNALDDLGYAMLECDYLVEILSPKRLESADNRYESSLFAERYYRIVDLGLGISVPDNPMGRPRLSFLEMIELEGLPVKPERVVMNLNTFHTKEELDELLKKAAELGLKYLLVVRGDGGPSLSKLDPKSIGGDQSIATTPDLLRYINTAYSGKFITGCAYNHYSPLPFELNRLKEKIGAGAKFVVTQPVIGKDLNVDPIFTLGIPIVIEAWMSKNVELLFKSVRKQEDLRAEEYDPVANLCSLHDAYPDRCIYLSMLGFKRLWREILPKL
jgi:methylenetetrahydrofolate reductase (NADPH)